MKVIIELSSPDDARELIAWHQRQVIAAQRDLPTSLWQAQIMERLLEAALAAKASEIDDRT